MIWQVYKVLVGQRDGGSESQGEAREEGRFSNRKKVSIRGKREGLKNGRGRGRKIDGGKNKGGDHRSGGVMGRDKKQLLRGESKVKGVCKLRWAKSAIPRCPTRTEGESGKKRSGRGKKREEDGEK